MKKLDKLNIQLISLEEQLTISRGNTLTIQERIRIIEKRIFHIETLEMKEQDN